MDGKIDVFVAGAGTGGTISGVGKYLKEKNSSVKVICADPVGSILYDLYYHKQIVDPPQPYKVEGVGEDMLPDNTHLSIMDGFEKVSDKEAFQMARRLTVEEGLCVGPSSALALVGAMKFAEKLEKPSNILVLFPDNGRGYISKAFNDQWMMENGFMEKALNQKVVSSLLPTLERKVRVNLQVHSNVREGYEAMKTNNCNEVLVYEKENLLGIIKLDQLLNSLVSGKLKPTDSVIHLVQSSFNFIDKDMPLEKVLGLLDDHKDIVLKNGPHTYIVDKSDLIEILL
jgi:predicted transcriptional regulator